jgi:hypothetical protein
MRREAIWISLSVCRLRALLGRIRGEGSGKVGELFGLGVSDSFQLGVDAGLDLELGVFGS